MFYNQNPHAQSIYLSFQPSQDEYNPTFAVDYDGTQQNLKADTPANNYLAGGYHISHIKPISGQHPPSSDLQAFNALPEFSLFKDDSTFRDDGRRSLNFTQRADIMIQPTELPLSLQQQDHYTSSDSMLLAMAFDNTSKYNLVDGATATQAVPTMAECNSYWNDFVPWNELSNGNTSTGLWSRGAGNSDWRGSHLVFDEIASSDNADINVFHKSPSRSLSTFHHPSLSPSITTEQGFSDVTWASNFTNLTQHAPQSQFQPNLNTGDGAHWSKTPYVSLSSIKNIEESSIQANESTPTAAGQVLCEDLPHPLVLFSESTSMGRVATLMPKPTPSLNIPAASEFKLALLRTPPEIGRRKKYWDKKRRERTRRMRDVGACVTCRLRKTRCSGKRDEPCELCVSKPLPCLRGSLPDFENIFCPTFVFGHLEVLATEDWIKENHWSTIGQEISIQVSSCPFFNSMSFNVREFLPTTPDILSLPELSSDSNDALHNFAQTVSLPYALSAFDVPQIKLKCEGYIKTLSTCPLTIAESLDENTSPMVWRSLEAVQRFIESNSRVRQDRLLNNVINLYWTLYSLGRDIIIDPESVTIAVASLQNPLPPSLSQSYLSARVLARQVKTAMSLVYKDLLSEVLKGLEELYKSDSVMSSAIAFCTNIVLCFIAEELEIVIDGFGIYKISKGEDPEFIARRSGQCCKLLEDVLIHYSWAVFFDKNRRYNVNGDDHPADDLTNQNEGVAGLSEDFYQILQEFEHEIADKADVTYIAASRTLLDHMKLGIQNSGRHVAAYLHRFY